MSGQSYDFTEPLRELLHEYRRECLADQTVGMGIDCAFQCLGGKIQYLPGAPKGTNAAYYAKEAMRDVIAGDATLKRFYYEQR